MAPRPTNPARFRWAPATNWQTVAAGYYHTVALKRDGTLWAWGDNYYGQLGDGTTANQSSPVQVGVATNWQAVAAGSYHTVALKRDGTLWAWGNNSYGQLGDGTTVGKSSPFRWAARPTGRRWRRDMTTRWRSRATARSGLGATIARPVGGWHHGQQIQPGCGGHGHQLAGVAAGCFHTVALKRDGTLWAWGEMLWPVGRWHYGQPIQPGCGRHRHQLAGGGGGLCTHGGAQA